jgi:hypothetical protein
MRTSSANLLLGLYLLGVFSAQLVPDEALAQGLTTPKAPQATPKPQAPQAKMIVGSPACPKLNAHNNQACRFSRGGHDFQVWPGRISIQATSDPSIWLVTSTGHPDGMFDHTYKYRKDDHVTFQCFVKRDGQFYGPTGFGITRGGAWVTYGKGVVAAVTVVASYFGTPVAGVAGGAAAELLGMELSKAFGNKSWEVQAGKVANDICKALAR